VRGRRADILTGVCLSWQSVGAASLYGDIACTLAGVQPALVREGLGTGQVAAAVVW